MSLLDEIVRVQRYLTEPGNVPTNEANTCVRVITPLLQKCGYDLHEMDIQALSVGGTYPDYTILSNTPHHWFLEAKTWQQPLADSHANQAMNYAHNEGKRWVVLSNGREWRLYDDHIVGGPAAGRLVATAKLESSSEMEAMLTALSKASVQSGGLAAYALQSRIAAVLDAQLQVPTSDIVKGITTALKNRHGLTSATGVDVVSYLSSRNQVHLVDASIAPATLQAPPQSQQTPLAAPQSESDATLLELVSLGSGIQRTKPDRITFPDHTHKQVSSWRDLAVSAISWLYTNNHRPNLPFRGRQSGKVYLINTSPSHSDGAAMARYKTLVTGSSTLFIHVNRNADDFVSCLKVLCDEVGVPASDFKIVLKT